MPEFREFLGLPRWTEAELNAFIAARFPESHVIEYKQGDWIFETKDGREVLRSARRDELREYAAGISTVGGGLMFLGVPERSRGEPDKPDGVPVAVWGAKGPAHVLGNILWDGIYPRLYPGPRIHDVPLAGVVGRSVVVIEFPPPVHSHYRVLHKGGFVPVRFGDGLRAAPPGLEAALVGERGRARPALEIRLPNDDELAKVPDTWFRTAADLAAKHIYTYPVYIANHGLASAEGLRVGVITSYNQCKQSVTQGLAARWEERIVPEIPRPLSPLFQVDQPLVRIMTPPHVLGPADETAILVGAEMDFGKSRIPNIGIFAVAEGVAPIARAFNIGGRSGGEWPAVINVADAPAGPPYIWGQRNR